MNKEANKRAMARTTRIARKVVAGLYETPTAGAVIRVEAVRKDGVLLSMRYDDDVWSRNRMTEWEFGPRDLREAAEFFNTMADIIDGEGQ